ncbi:MAG: hypothetical protein JWQ48_4182 [Conexibacter sp.]|jgi:hypothetical protein|nr:hypothetical protein [Conexibacter sp.]
MSRTTNILVVATVTAGSDELRAALRRRAERSSIAFTLIVPATGLGRAGRESAAKQLEAALDSLRAAGLEIEGRVGDSDPILAVYDVFEPARFDEVIVSTLPPGVSKWLQCDLPHRVASVTGLQVTHVVAQEPKAPLAGVSPPEHPHRGVLAPLEVLTWGAKPPPV